MVQRKKAAVIFLPLITTFGVLDYDFLILLLAKNVGVERLSKNLISVYLSKKIQRVKINVPIMNNQIITCGDP